MWDFDQGMMMTLSGNWWMLLIRGLAAIAFGLLAYFYPGAALAALVLIYGVYALVDGVFAIVAAINQGEHHRPWGFLLFSGIVSIIAGLVTFFYPGITALVLLTIIAAWGIVRGVLEIAAAVQLRRVVPHDWLLALAGILSIVFGVLLIAYPATGLLAVVWLIATYAIIYGILEIALAMRVHRYSAPLAMGS